MIASNLTEADEVYEKVLQNGCFYRFRLGEQTKENFVKYYLETMSISETRLIFVEFNFKYYTMLPMIESLKHTSSRYSIFWLKILRVSQYLL
ncbi:UNKNOWN [Stylonychia lemnae]|uniref:Uncharacterized protein n=1 Tax=Stylonychia lemnae TaxID=5949 RepID=A0A078A4N2_STYLE|nr:UNKNOWN [Stylonychia lemnae]|eukprot:CDW76839.1 UNKNOWN [Stylonychia lemnae]